MPIAKAANFPCTKVDEGLFYVELFLFNKGKCISYSLSLGVNFCVITIELEIQMRFSVSNYKSNR